MRKRTHRLTAKMTLKITSKYLQKAPHPSTAMATAVCSALREKEDRINTHYYTLINTYVNTQRAFPHCLMSYKSLPLN